jgi:hypothetical protein
MLRSVIGGTPTQRGHRQSATVRADVNYARMAPVVKDLLGHFRYPLSRLGSLTSKVQYGSSSKAVEEAVGTPMIRMTNLQNGEAWPSLSVRGPNTRSTIPLDRAGPLLC